MASSPLSVSMFEVYVVCGVFALIKNIELVRSFKDLRDFAISRSLGSVLRAKETLFF